VSNVSGRSEVTGSIIQGEGGVVNQRWRLYIIYIIVGIDGIG
jgi:hypothetical protein